MTRDVLISISGLHTDLIHEPDMDPNEPIEIVTPASYYEKDDKHYIFYDELLEGFHGVIRNKIKITGSESLEIQKSGLSNAHMIFEKDKKNLTYYDTPYGQMLIGVNTRLMEVNITDANIKIRVDYELDVNHEPLADCSIRMNIFARKNSEVFDA